MISMRLCPLFAQFHQVVFALFWTSTKTGEYWGKIQSFLFVDPCVKYGNQGISGNGCKRHGFLYVIVFDSIHLVPTESNTGIEPLYYMRNGLRQWESPEMSIWLPKDMNLSTEMDVLPRKNQQTWRFILRRKIQALKRRMILPTINGAWTDWTIKTA